MVAVFDKIKHIAVMFAAMLCIAVAAGCSDAVKFTLLRTEISLTVGDTRDILPYVAFTPATNRAAVTLQSNDDCVVTDGTKVTAVASGTATVTVRAGGASATVTVVCAHGAPQELDITSNDLVQTVAAGKKISTVKFSVSTEVIDTDTDIIWSVGGATHAGRDYEFTPPDYGEYQVTARYGELSATRTVRVYRPSSAEIIVDGQLNQTNDFSPVTFTAKEKINTLNPPSVYAWYVNGEAMGSGAVFSFTPSAAGEYNIELRLNGAESASKTISASGARAPRGEVVFDDVDGIQVSWHDGGSVRYISVIDPDGKRTTYDATDANCAHIFGRGQIDADELIQLYSQEPGEYRIILGGQVQSEFTFTQLDPQAEKYVDDVVLIKNSYIDCADDAYDYIAELYACVKGHGECYAACDVSVVIAAINDAAARLGLIAQVNAAGNIISVDFDSYVNAPSGAETSNVNTVYAELPHINYDQDAARQSNYVFPSDRANKSVAVNGTEQLLLAIQGGARPMPEQGSAAYTAYRAAKRVLLGIIGADYSPKQKVHAIYDWLQWVTVKSYTQDRTKASNYADGVFCVRRTSGSGYAVTSAGAAKAFALMCAIEGIDCTLEYAADGMYDRVAIDGLWYNVDVFGGKVGARERGANVTSELTSHRGLLIPDVPTDEESTVQAFDMSQSVYLQKYRRDEKYFDKYIDEAEADDEKMIAAAVFEAFDGVAVGSVRVPYVDSEVQIYNNSYGVEFCYRGDNISAFTAVVEQAAVDYAKKILNNAKFSRIRVEVIGNKVFITAISPYND